MKLKSREYWNSKHIQFAYFVLYAELFDEIEVEKHSNSCTQSTVIIQREVIEVIVNQSEMLRSRYRQFLQENNKTIMK